VCEVVKESEDDDETHSSKLVRGGHIIRGQNGKEEKVATS
jgi:hypothetical protein